MAQELNKLDDIAGIEVNISCPNVKQGGIAFGTNPKLTYKVIKAVVETAPNKFIISKLSPNVGNIVNIAQKAVKAGSDAISLVNTFLGMDIDVETRLPKIKNIFGGLSGPAIRPLALKLVWDLYQANLGIPIIGMGGIDSSQAAAEFFMAGSNAIAVGTGGFSNRQIFSEIDEGLQEILKSHNLNTINELVGSMKID